MCRMRLGKIFGRSLWFCMGVFLVFFLYADSWGACVAGSRDVGTGWTGPWMSNGTSGRVPDSMWSLFSSNTPQEAG
jgi:hypothetical protein